MKILIPSWLLTGSVLFSLLTVRPATAQTILSLDFDERGNQPGTTQAGFESFVINSNTSETATQTLPTTRTFGAYSVTVSLGDGASSYDDRLRSTPTDSGEFTQSLLLRDFVFCGTATSGTGLDVLVEGLTPGTTYAFTIWSFDVSSTGNRVSDWSANGFPVLYDYLFNGSSLPINDTQYQFSFKVLVPPSGQVLIEGRRDAATSSAGSVFINALQVAVSTPDPPPPAFSITPVKPIASENTTVTLQAVDLPDHPPLLLQWQRGDGVGGFTNIPDANAISYTSPPLQLSDDGALFRLSASNFFGGGFSDVATLTVNVDTNPPTVLAMQTEYPYTNLVVTYSEPVDPTSATDVFAYQDPGGLVYFNASTWVDARTIALEAGEPFVVGNTYTIEVSGVQDLAPLPNLLVTTNFTFTVTPRLSVDFDERGGEFGSTEFGFNSFLIESEISATTIQTNPSTRTFGPISITLSGTGADPGYDDRLRSTPLNTNDFTQSLLLRDFVFSRAQTAGEGLDLRVTGLTGGATYLLTLWSFDSGTTGNRLSDWRANGSLVRSGYAFDGAVLPTSNDQYQLSFKVTAPPSGEVLIAARSTAAQFAVFLNALRLEISTPDAPAMVQHPSPQTIYAGDHAIFTAQASGTAPFHFQWQKDGEDLPGSIGDTLIITNAPVGASGQYSVTVTNAGGSAASGAAQLNVLPVDNLESGLLAHWPLDVLAETTPDLGPFGQALVQTNMASTNLVSGHVGNAVDFNGTNQLLIHELAPGDGLPAYAYPAYTVALWVKGVGEGQSDRRVYSESSTTNNSPLLNIGTATHGTNGTVDIYIRNSVGGVAVNHFLSTLEAFDGNWHHVAWVDNQGFGRIYVDGTPDPNELVYARGLLTPNTVTLGGILRAEPSHWFTGAIDEVQVWRRALSPAEIQHVAQGVPSLAIAGLTVEGATLVLTFNSSDPAAAHRIEEAADLSAPIWTPVANVSLGAPVGNLRTATFPRPTDGQRFYRAVLE